MLGPRLCEAEEAENAETGESDGSEHPKPQRCAVSGDSEARPSTSQRIASITTAAGM